MVNIQATMANGQVVEWNEKESRTITVSRIRAAVVGGGCLVTTDKAGVTELINTRFVCSVSVTNVTDVDD